MSSTPSVVAGTVVPDPRRWYTLAAVTFGLFMALLDVTVVNVALPDIAIDFSSSFAGLQWVIASYTLTYAACILTMAKLGDLFGRKRIFLAGLILFSCASLACGLAQDVTQLQVARGVQGVGAAVITPLAAAIISTAFAGPERGTAFGIYGAVSGLALALGPIIGGALVTYLDWRAVFFVNVPIGVIGLVAGIRFIGESTSRRNGRYIDVSGSLLSIATLFVLTLALIRGDVWGWASGPTIGAFTAAALGLAAFVAIEFWHLRRGLDPMMDLTLFRNSTFNAVAVVTLAVMAVYGGLMLAMALLFQNLFGFDALGTGLRYLPLFAVGIVVAPFSGKLANRLGWRTFFVVAILGFGAGLAMMTMLDGDSAWTALLPGMILTGLAGTSLQAQITTAALESAPVSSAGMASGISGTMRQVGASIGVAVLGAVMTARYGAAFPGELADHGVPAGVADRLLAGAGGNVATAGRAPNGVSANLARAIVESADAAFVSAFRDMLWVAVLLMAFALLVSARFIRQREVIAEPVSDPPGVPRSGVVPD